MRKEKALILMLRGLVDLINEEAARNPEFSAQLDHLLSPLPSRKVAKKKRRTLVESSLPDIYSEFTARGPTEFTLWLRDHPVEVLRGLIRLHDLDATRRTSKWKDNGKLSNFISEQIRSRTARGSSFLTTDSST
jgi:hypothetical protein